MSRSLNRSVTMPAWEADKLNRQAKKLQKQNRQAYGNKRNTQDGYHKVD